MKNILRRKRRGQGMVEAAIVLPILFLVILCGLDALQVYIAHYTVNQAARVAAHQAALLGGYDQSVADIAATTLNSGIFTNAASMVISGGCGSAPDYRRACRRYDAITIKIIYTSQVFVPFGPFNQFTVTRYATRAAEQDASE